MLTTVLWPLLPILVPGHVSGALTVVISLRYVSTNPSPRAIPSSGQKESRCAIFFRERKRFSDVFSSFQQDFRELLLCSLFCTKQVLHRHTDGRCHAPQQSTDVW